MTAKRFKIVSFGFLTSFEDNGVKMTHKQIVECLNTLHEENQQLRKENKALKDANEGLIGTIAHFELEDLE